MLRICVGLHRRDKCQSFINKRPQKQRDEKAETGLIEPQTKNNSYFPLYWLFNRDPHNVFFIAQLKELWVLGFNSFNNSTCLG